MEEMDTRGQNLHPIEAMGHPRMECSGSHWSCDTIGVAAGADARIARYCGGNVDKDYLNSRGIFRDSTVGTRC